MYVPYNIRKVFEKASMRIRNKKMLIISHKDADGFLSYALLQRCMEKDEISRLFLNILTPDILDSIPMDFDAYLFVDTGNCLEKNIFERFRNKTVIILDHHPTSYNKIFHSQNHFNINAYLLGMDGNKDICSAGLSYLLSKSVSKYAFEGYFYIPVAGAFADMQISREIKGFNSFFLHNALARGEMTIEKSLILPAKSVRPLYKSIEFFMNDRGIEYTSYDAILFLKNIGVNPYKMDLFRRIPRKADDLSEDEIKLISTHLAIELQERGVESEEILREAYIIKNKYLLEEFVTLTNACVKLGYVDNGLSLVFKMKDMYHIYENYRREIGKGFNKAYRNLQVHDNIAYYIFDKKDLRDSSLTGSIATMLNKKVMKEIIFIGYLNEDIIKFSIRSKNIDVNSLVREFCNRVPGCYGNGHPHAAGGTIPREHLNEFIEFLDTHAKTA